MAKFGNLSAIVSIPFAIATAPIPVAVHASEHGRGGFHTKLLHRTIPSKEAYNPRSRFTQLTYS